MAKLHYCSDGVPVTDKVLLYQNSRSGDDYIKIYNYYEDFKDRWFKDLQEYLDRPLFDSEFDYKLCIAVETFNGKQAKFLCDKNNWSFLGAFNRWFYAVLRNWKSNVKTSSFRQKKRPSVQCPVCGRFVPKIDEIHLGHFKGKGDLPKVFTWHRKIYSVLTVPEALVVCWGDFTQRKLRKLNNREFTEYEKKKVECPWRTKDKKLGVVCPFTKKIIPEISAEYIQSLPNKYSRYAPPMKWQEFLETYSYPMLIQAEVYSLDYSAVEDEVFLWSNISVSERSAIENVPLEDNSSIQYEHVFHLIETHIEDETDQKILKLASIGYADEDIASSLDLTKKEVRSRKKEMRISSEELRQKLLESV